MIRTSSPRPPRSSGSISAAAGCHRSGGRRKAAHPGAGRAQGYRRLPNARALSGRSHDYKRNGTWTGPRGRCRSSGLFAISPQHGINSYCHPSRQCHSQARPQPPNACAATVSADAKACAVCGSSYTKLNSMRSCERDCSSRSCATMRTRSPTRSMHISDALWDRRRDAQPSDRRKAGQRYPRRA
jgi:hypothetical protein